MYDFLKENSLFVVLGITLVIFLGIALYLSILDNKISKLEKLIETKIEN